MHENSVALPAQQPSFLSSMPLASKQLSSKCFKQLSEFNKRGRWCDACCNIFSRCWSSNTIRRPESAWLGNILFRIQTVRSNPNPSPKSKIQNPKSKIQNPKSEFQNPKSKIQTGPFGAATKKTKTKLIQNPKSEIQNPKSKIQNPKSKIQNPKSEIQNPKS